VFRLVWQIVTVGVTWLCLKKENTSSVVEKRAWLLQCSVIPVHMLWDGLFCFFSAKGCSIK